MRWLRTTTSKRDGKKTLELVATALSLTVACTLSARAQPVCSPGAAVQIEALPALPSALRFTGNTCDPGLSDRVSRYRSCRISADYSKPEAIYKVWLHDGNQVEFNLTVLSGDLALALIRTCGDGGSCVSSSDNINPPPPPPGRTANEKLLSQNYKPAGFYYLYVDARGSGVGCGRYELAVSGVNPVPDLVVSLTSAPKPVVAGETLTYTLSVKNMGALDATGVVITQTLSPGVSLPMPTVPGCTVSGTPMTSKKVTCQIPSLLKGSTFARTIQVRMAPSTRGSLSSTASAKANEGDQNPADNQQTETTNVKALSALSIEKLASRAVPVAGEPLTYTLRVHNAGPSDATSVTVTDSLPGALTFVSAPGCQNPQGTVTCPIPTIPAGATVERSINVNVQPSVSDGSQVANTASVNATESGPGFISGSVTTPVIRKADLSIVKTAPATVTAGEELTYEIKVCNQGPSDSSGATITDPLPVPEKVHFLRSQDGCAPGADGKVTCTIGTLTVGGCRTLHFVAGVDPSLKATTLINKASIKALETDSNLGNDTSNSVATQVMVKADLTVKKTARRVSDFAVTDSAVAGANLVYALEVRNAGPSDSPGGIVHDMLPSGLSFVASPDGCQEANGLVSCTVPPLPTQQTYVARFVVRLPAGATETFANAASVNGQDDPRHDNDTSASVSTLVKQEADLAVTVSSSPDPVNLSLSHDLLYTVQVTNNGPSNATDVKVILELPEGGTLVLPTPCGPGAGERLVECTLAALPAGGSDSFEIHVLVPGQHGTATATASVTAKTPDPNPSNDTALETTTLANATEADIVVTKTAGVEAVAAGDVIPYTIEVVNRGPADAEQVKVFDVLPSGVTLLSWTDCQVISGSGRVPICDLGPLKKERRTLALTVRVDSDFAATPSLLSNRAFTPESSFDPNPANNDSTAETPVLHVAPLVLPFFKADAVNVNTLLAVRNPSEGTLGVRLDYFLAGQPVAEKCETQCLVKKQTLTWSLRDRFPGLGLKEGHVGITPISSAACQSTSSCDPAVPPSLLTPAPVPPLSGDFIRVEPANGHASSQLLISTDTSRFPPELCRNWSVRFLNGASFGGSTEFFFFVPGNHERSEPVAVGKVYDETGQFVQEISITASGETFRRTTQEGFNGVPLLASFGAIEWEFLKGVVGNVSAIHRAQGGYTVAVPGFCRQPSSAADLGPEPPLLVPYFEADSVKATLFAVRNESENTIVVTYEYFSGDGDRQHMESLPLTAHATRTVNLRDIPELRSLNRGYIQIGVAGSPVHHERILSGDFVRIDPAHGLASGGALVDTDLQRSPRQLCQKWNVRFLKGGILNATTDFVFYLQRNGNTSPVTATGLVYNEAGDTIGLPVLVPSPLSSLTAFQVDGSLLALTENGSIEWDLGDLKGNVASVFRAGDLSVLVPGVCIQ